MNDRTRLIIAFLFIMLILFIWNYLSKPAEKKAPSEPVVKDSVVKPVDIVEPEFLPTDEETIVVDKKDIKVVLSSIGGSVKSFILKKYDVNLVPAGGYLFVNKIKDSTNNIINLDYSVFDDSVIFSHESDDKTLKKVYNFEDAFGFRLTTHSSDPLPQILSLKSGLRITEIKNRGDDLRNFNVYIKDEKLNNVTKKVKDEYEYAGKVDWFALRNKYFILVVNNLGQLDRIKFYKLLKDVDEEEPNKAGFGCYYMGGGGDRYGAEIFNQNDINISVLLLPMDYNELIKYQKGYEEIASGGFWGPISRIIMLVLNFIYSILKNYGFVIMIFAILIKIIFFPLSRQMIVSQHKMQMVQPELKKIQQKYKNDPQRLNQEMMHLYRTYKVNPFSGCLPLLIQFPIFIALFRTLTTSIEFRQAHFIFWITDLSIKDPYYVLPISMGVMMLIQSLSTTIDPRQRFMVFIMPVVMVWIFLNLPSGLQLYWFTYNILTLIEHFVTKRGGIK